MPGQSRVTMPDVAREAGVSAMTVSYTFNRPERVAAATRQRVLAAAERLGYSGPHPGARSLRRGRTGTLGVVLGEHLTYAFDDPQAVQFLAGIAGVCVEHELGLALIPVTGGPQDATRILEAAVDAVVLWTTVDDDPVLDAVLKRGLPAVVHGGPARPGIGLVAIDDRAAARAVGAAAFTAARAPAVLSFPLDRVPATGGPARDRPGHGALQRHPPPPAGLRRRRRRPRPGLGARPGRGPGEERPRRGRGGRAAAAAAGGRVSTPSRR